MFSKTQKRNEKKKGEMSADQSIRKWLRVDLAEQRGLHRGDNRRGSCGWHHVPGREGTHWETAGEKCGPVGKTTS